MKQKSFYAILVGVSILVILACYLLGTRHSDNPAIRYPAQFFPILYASFLAMIVYNPNARLRRPQKILAVVGIVIFLAFTLYIQLPDAQEVVGLFVLGALSVILVAQVLLRERYRKQADQLKLA